MAMRRLPFALFFAVLSGAGQTAHGEPASTLPLDVPADQLMSDAARYRDRLVRTEGTVVHICSVDRRKLKLKTPASNYLKVVPQTPAAAFDPNLLHQRVQVTGRVELAHLTRAQLEKAKRDKTLLCHVDHRPCRDAAWAARQRQQGRADALVERDYLKLSQELQRHDPKGLRVVTISAQQVRLVAEPRPPQ